VQKQNQKYLNHSHAQIYQIQIHVLSVLSFNLNYYLLIYLDVHLIVMGLMNFFDYSLYDNRFIDN
jgi:hypothetical protein